jgi:hypothetical protein
MKKIFALIVLFYLVGIHSIGYSQKFEAGISSGVNFSDIHGQAVGGKWSTKTGPTQWINFQYSINKVLGFQTGLNFSTTYYEQKTSQVYSPILYETTSSYYDPRLRDPYYYPSHTPMDFRFIRIPLLFTVTIPAEIDFRLKAGIYFGKTKDYNMAYYSEEPVKHDFGYIFSSGISYPISEQFRMTLDMNYLTGRTQFLEGYNYRHGSEEVTLGISYSWPLKKKENRGATVQTDSSSHMVSVSYNGGVNYSWNKGETADDNFSGISGPSMGFLINFPLEKNCSFKTGLSFERKGYSMSDSSASFYRTIETGSPMYQVDTKVQIDYAVIPAILSFPAGGLKNVFLSTGPWFGLKLNARTVGTAYNESSYYYNYQVTETTVYDDLEKAIKDYDIGWLFGIGAYMPVWKDYRVNIGFQYSTGFKDVFDYSGAGNAQNPYDDSHVIKNGTVSFVIGVTIPPGKR